MIELSNFRFTFLFLKLSLLIKTEHLLVLVFKIIFSLFKMRNLVSSLQNLILKFLS